MVAVGLAAGGIDFSTTALVGLLLPPVALLGLSASALLERAWNPRASIVQALAIQTATGAVVFTAVASLTGQMEVSVNADFVWAMLWLIFLSGIGGYAAYTACLRVIGPTNTSVLLFLTPPVTSLWTWLMFGHSVGVGQMFGMFLGVLAVVLTVSGQRTPKRSAA